MRLHDNLSNGGVLGQNGFDLAWLPSFFIPETSLDDAIRRVRELLRPEGRVVVGVMFKECRSPNYPRAAE